MSIEPGILYVVATPIGNLGDTSSRALETLREVSQIAAEDTRHTQRLLQHFGINARLISFHDHNEHARVPQITAAMRAGESVALVSDAGTPLLSDPGFQLLRSVREQGLKAIPIPGPCSVIAALSVAGLPTDRFVFEGFLPNRASARRNRLDALKRETRTLVFLEASHRIQASLDDMGVVFGGRREAVVARELTKLHEEVRSGCLDELRVWCGGGEDHRRGEFVVVVHGASESTDSERITVEARVLMEELLKELPVSRAVAAAIRITGLKKNVLYDLALSLKDRE